MIMTGDFNLPIITWARGQIYSGPEYMRTQAERFPDFVNEFMLEQCITEPTRENNIVHVFSANDYELVSGSTNSYTILSDHRIIVVTTKLSCGTLRKRRLPD